MPVDPAPTPEPNLDSFVLRFVRSGEPATSGAAAHRAQPHGVNDGTQGGSWHGVIRHVQSNRERAFSRWADATAFIGEFVDLREQGVRQHGAQEPGNE
jgi:hypothetical protein